MPQTRPRVLFVSHSASRNGASILLLSFLQWLRPRVDWDIEILVHGTGPLLDEFRRHGHTTVWRDPAPRLQSLLPRSFGGIKHAIESAYQRLTLPAGHYDLVYANTMAAAPLITAMGADTRALLWHVHELDYAIASTLTKPLWVERFRSSTRVVAVSEAVRDTLITNHGIEAGRIDLVHGFITSHRLDAHQARCRRDQVRSKLGIRPEAFVVGACGSLGWRKGTDLFLQIARHAVAAAPDSDIEFLWVGGEQHGSAALEFEYDMRMLGLDLRCRLVTTTPDVQDYYCAMDVFALTSREDPFPLVVLEAADHNVPTVCFDGAGGAAEFVANNDGRRVPYLDVYAFARQIVELCSDPASVRALGARAHAKVRRAHQIETQGPKLLRSAQDCIEQRPPSTGTGAPRMTNPLLTQ